MCGFAGVISWEDRYRVTRETLSAMSARIAHRGPDGEGMWTNHTDQATRAKPQAALAHRRLAILDPDPRSNQPFTDGRHWLVFNGEIYNFRELRAELTAIDSSYEWRTSGDTEVLLRAYAVWREKCLPRLNGMFALAIWDEQKRELFLARDRMGQKPLFVASRRRENGTACIAFASEMGALRELPWISCEIRLDAIRNYLRWGYNDGQPVYRDIIKIGPARWLRRSFNDSKERAYFDPNCNIPLTQGRHSSATHEIAIKRTRRLMTRAVERQMVSDVPLGCFLSGGIDSSIIASLMRASLGDTRALHTFSIGFDDPRYDESRYAREVAGYLRTTHHEFRVKPDAIADLPLLAAAFGEPFGDSSALPTYYLSRETRKHVKVALSGDGGDELFGGYDRYRAMRWAQRLELFPKAVRRAGASGLHRLPGGHPKSRLARLKRFAAGLTLTPGARYASFIELFGMQAQTSLWTTMPVSTSESSGPVGYCRLDICFDGDRYFRGTDCGDDVVTAMQHDRVTYLPDDLLTKVDRASMRHALEVRSPFMDHELVHFAASLKTDELLNGGPKRMLREAFADDLPDFVFKRKKMGFAVPIGDWFRGELRSMLRDNLFASDSFARQHFNMPTVQRLVDEHEQSRVDHSQRLYALLMLELWKRTQ